MFDIFNTKRVAALERQMNYLYKEQGIILVRLDDTAKELTRVTREVWGLTLNQELSFAEKDALAKITTKE